MTTIYEVLGKRITFSLYFFSIIFMSTVVGIISLDTDIGRSMSIAITALFSAIFFAVMFFTEGSMD